MRKTANNSQPDHQSANLHDVIIVDLFSQDYSISFKRDSLKKQNASDQLAFIGKISKIHQSLLLISS
jgi:hypothetical protein